MKYLSLVNFTALLLFVTNASLAGDNQNLEACNQKFTQTQAGTWDFVGTWRDLEGVIVTNNVTATIEIDDDVVSYEGMSSVAGEFSNEHPIGLVWTRSDAGLTEDKTTVTVTDCYETDRGIIRETQTTGTLVSNGDPVSFTQQQYLFNDDSFVSSTRIKRLHKKEDYVYLWTRGSKID